MGQPLHSEAVTLEELLSRTSAQHPTDEHCVVLEGTLRIGSLTFGAGAYQLAESGFPHPPVIAETAALVFIHGPT